MIERDPADMTCTSQSLSVTTDSMNHPSFAERVVFTPSRGTSHSERNTTSSPEVPAQPPPSSLNVFDLGTGEQLKARKARRKPSIREARETQIIRQNRACDECQRKKRRVSFIVGCAYSLLTRA